MFYHPSGKYFDCKVIVKTLRDMFRFAAWGSQSKQSLFHLCWMKVGSGEAPKIHTVARFTWNLKINRTKTNLNLETIILRFHVGLWGCIRILCIWIYGYLFWLVVSAHLKNITVVKMKSSPSRGENKKIFETTT